MQLCCIILTMVSCWFVEVHCTRPQNLTAKAVWKRTMSLSWKPAPFMGRYSNILCYRIWYAAAHDKKNEVNFPPFFFFFLLTAKMKSILNFCDDFYLLPQIISVHLLCIFFYTPSSSLWKQWLFLPTSLTLWPLVFHDLTSSSSSLELSDH